MTTKKKKKKEEAKLYQNKNKKDNDNCSNNDNDQWPLIHNLKYGIGNNNARKTNKIIKTEIS